MIEIVETTETEIATVADVAEAEARVDTTKNPTKLTYR